MIVILYCSLYRNVCLYITRSFKEKQMDGYNNLLSPSYRHDFSTFRANHLNINQCWISWKFSQFRCRQCKSKPTPLKHVFTYRLNGILCYIRCTLFMGEFTQFYTSIESRGCQIFALDSAFTVICKYLRKICFILFVRRASRTHSQIRMQIYIISELFISPYSRSIRRVITPQL